MIVIRLNDYLNIEDTVTFIKEVVEIQFFNEGNLFDLVVKDELQPIVYFDGYGLTDKNKLYSLYPEDFKDTDEWFEIDIDHLSQSNYIKGYFYILFGETILTSEKPIEHRRFIIQNLVGYQPIPDYSLPNKGLNSKGDILGRTPLYVTDRILLSTKDPHDEIIDPSFTKNDVRFYIVDIVNMLFKNGLISEDCNKQSKSSQLDDEPTHHKSVGAMQTLIATLIKMAEYDKSDLADPYGELNKLIQAKSELLGLSVKKDFVAKWLKNADDVL